MANQIITVKYNELQEKIPTLTEGNYDLTVDCTGVEASEFAGTYDESMGIPTASPFGHKLQVATDGVFFNLIPINVESDVTNASYMFFYCSKLTSIDTSGFTKVTNAENMFNGCSSLTSIDTKGFTNVTNASSMFYQCSSLTSIDTKAFTKVTDARFMFHSCSSLTSIDTTTFTKVTNAKSMFSFCYDLTSITWGENFLPDNCSYMFSNCSKQISITTKDWYTNTYINNNSSNMRLTDYKLLNEYPKPDIPIPEKVHYNDLMKSLMLYEPREEPYNLTVDCTGVDASEFKGVFNTSSPEPMAMRVPSQGETNSNSPLMLKLSSAVEGVYFNLTINIPETVTDATACFMSKLGKYGEPLESNLVSINITNETLNITNASGMFYNCRSLTSIDTKAFTNVTDASGMFINCSKLTSITWGENFLPDNCSYMFSNCSKQISITTKDWYTNTYINNNSSNMRLTDYKLLNEYPKPDIHIPEKVHYNDLMKSLMLYEPRPEPYNLTVDCTGVDASEFKGVFNISSPGPRAMRVPSQGETNSNSPLMLKLSSAVDGVFFNLTINIPETVTDATACFMTKLGKYGEPLESNLVSINITNETLNITNASFMFVGCDNLTSIDTTAFTNVTNAYGMFGYCASLTSITWGDEFRPDLNKVTNMFSGATSPKVITASADSMTWINNNDTAMSLSNYTFGEKEEPISLTYAQLDTELSKLEPHYTYNLTVNCTDVPASEFIGNDDISPFGQKLQTAPLEVYFNLKPINVGSDVTNASNMFYNCSSLTSIDTSGFTNVTDASYMFQDCSNLTSIDTKGFTNVTNASQMFSGCSNLTSIDTKAFTNVTDAFYMFQYCSNLTSIDTSGFTNVTDASYMFQDCSNLTSIDTKGFTNVTYAVSMFQDCSNLTSIDTTAFTSVTDASSMFYDCNSLTSIDTKGFTNVTDAEYMFQGCRSLTSIDTKAFTNVTDANNMFYRCSSLTSIDTSGFTSVTDASNMFSTCSSLTSITWKNLLPDNYSSMFYNCPQAKTIEVDWYTRTYLTDDKANSMNLVNYTLNGGDGEKPAITDTIHYNDLRKNLMFLYDPRPEPYNLTVDCTGVAASEFKGVYNPETGEIKNSPLMLKLSSAVDGVFFNLTINIPETVTDATACFIPKLTPEGYTGESNLLSINITNETLNITNASYMFYNCSRLTSIDTTAFTKVINASGMFSHCSLTSIDTTAFTSVTDANAMFNSCNSLTSITWGDLFRPTSFNSMFYRADAPKTITASVDSQEWINTNATAMGLTNYKIVIKESCKYNELDNLIPTLTAGTYNLTVDCTGVAASEFAGTYDESFGAPIASPFGEKLQVATDGVFFNLIPINVESDVTNASYMFFYCSKLTSIDTKGFTSVTNAKGMFINCSNLTSIDTKGFTNVTDARDMFHGCSNLTSIDTTAFTNVTDAYEMFGSCSSLTSITWGENFLPDNCSYMFSNCSKQISITTKDWYTNTYINNNSSNMRLTDYKLLNEYPKPDIPIPEKVHYNDLMKSLMLYEPRPEPYNLTVDCTGVDASEFKGVFNTSSPEPRAMRAPSKIETNRNSPLMLKLSSAVKGVYFNLTINIPETVTDATACFMPKLDKYGEPLESNLVSINITNETLNITNASYMFTGCSNLTNIDTTAFTSVIDANTMFASCSSLTNIDTTAFTNVTNASNMFYYCMSLTEVIGATAFTKVTDAHNMFQSCSSLTSIDTTAFTKVTDASYMFYNCSSLTSIDTSGFTNVTNASWMFYECSSLTSITWGDKFRPNPNNMFSGATAPKTITASVDSQEWINANATAMSLSNYTFGEKEEQLSLTYAQLDTDLASLAPHYTYNLAIDCTGVSSSNIKTIGAKLETATEEVFFNITLNSIEPNVTDVSSMFSDCSKLVSVDISALNSVIDSSSMFNNCINLENIIWKNWFPTKCNSMFNNCPKQKNIDVDYYTKNFITENKNLLMLENYTLNGGEEEPPISESIHYNDLLESMMLYDPRKAPYTLTVDCTGVDNPTLKGFGTILKTAKEGVFFNIIPTNIGETITDTSSMFSECKNLTSIDTSNFLNVTNATNMFAYCDNLEKVIWGGSFRPTTNKDMFYKINKLINITASLDSETWIGDNAVSMSLLNYNLSYEFDSFKYRLDELNIKTAELKKDRDYWKKESEGGGAKELNIKYSELDTEIPKLKPFSTCNLTVDCTGVAPSEFVGNVDDDRLASPFWKKLNTFNNIGFNLTLKNIPDTVTDMSYCFVPNGIYDENEGYTKYSPSNLLSMNITNETLNITDASNMFWSCTNLTSIDTTAFTNVTNAYEMFYNCRSLTSITWGENFLPDICSDMFLDCSQHINISTKDWYTNTYIKNNASNMQLTDYKLLNEYPKPEVPIVESLSYNELTKQYLMLYEPRPEPYNLTVNCEGIAASEFVGDSYSASPFGEKLRTAKSGVYFNLKPINVGSDVTDASRMFALCSSLTSIDTKAFTNVTNAYDMFARCSSLTSIDTKGFTNVTNATYMFHGCSSLTSIDTTAFTNVTDANEMFGSCSSLTSIDTKGFTNVTDAKWMFSNCSSLTSITWGDEFRPDLASTTYMFNNANAAKVITATADSKAWIDANAETMSLTNYTVNVI